MFSKAYITTGCGRKFKYGINTVGC